MVWRPLKSRRALVAQVEGLIFFTTQVFSSSARVSSSRTRVPMSHPSAPPGRATARRVGSLSALAMTRLQGRVWGRGFAAKSGMPTL